MIGTAWSDTPCETHGVDELTPNERAAFLAQPVVATLATYKRDGSVLGASSRCFSAAPISKLGMCDEIRESASSSTNKRRPYRGVEAAGTASLVEGSYGQLLARMAPRYLPAGRPDALARDGVVLVLTPSRLRSWSFASWF